MTPVMGASLGKRTQVDRLADKALEDVEDAGLEHATPEQHALALQAAVYRELRNGGGRIIVVPMRAAFAFGVGTASAIASTVVGAVTVLGAG